MLVKVVKSEMWHGLEEFRGVPGGYAAAKVMLGTDNAGLLQFMVAHDARAKMRWLQL